jgi:hypothetical protein
VKRSRCPSRVQARRPGEGGFAASGSRSKVYAVKVDLGQSLLQCASANGSR